MPARIKHSIETRKFICALYQADRPRRYSKGRYKLEYISELTGVNEDYCWKIANAKV